uniref:Uncharacterized protein n=1 Tax=Ciona savignyi TaxID=51511 RepID=H2ZI55_CIOSA
MTQVNPNMTPGNLPPPPAQWISGELQNLRLDDYSSETSSGQFDSVSDDANIVGLQNQILSHMKPDHGAVDQMQQFEAYQQWQQVMIAQSLLNPQSNGVSSSKAH